MEILSWNRLVDRVKKDCEDRAALVAFPLFDAILKVFIIVREIDLMRVLTGGYKGRINNGNGI